VTLMFVLRSSFSCPTVLAVSWEIDGFDEALAVADSGWRSA